MAATLAVVYGGMQVAAVMPADAPVVIGLAAAAALYAVLCIRWRAACRRAVLVACAAVATTVMPGEAIPGSHAARRAAAERTGSGRLSRGDL
jgi:hypothetical protein